MRRRLIGSPAPLGDGSHAPSPAGLASVDGRPGAVGLDRHP